MNFQKGVVTCDPKLKGTTVTQGMVGLNTSGQYFEINSQTKKIFVSNLRGNFHNTDWNRDVVYTQSNLDLIHNESSYIRYYTGNGSVGVINYGTIAGGPDYGYTGISYESGISWGVEGAVAAHLGSSVIYGPQDQTQEHEGDVVSIMRPDHPYLLIDASHLPVGKKTTVGVTIEDQDSSELVSTSGSITVVETIFDKVNVLSKAYGSDIRLKGGFENELHLHDDDIVEGNALQVSAVSKDGTLHGQSLSGAHIEIEWSPNHDHNDVLKYAFYKQIAVVQNTRGKLWFYRCRRDHGHHHRICKQYASYPGPISQPIRDISHFSGLTFTWTCTSDDCMAIFVTDDGDVSTFPIGQGITGMYASEDDLVPNYVRLIATHDDKVEIFRGSRYEPGGMVLWYTLSQANSGESWFCPKQVYHCPINEDVLLVMNNCQGYNQKILKYKIGDMTVDFINATNLDSLNADPFFCPMGHEFIVGSTSSKHKHPLYSFGTSDDLNFWSVPPNLLGDNFWNYSCLTHMFRFVSYGFNKDGTVTATTIVGNRGSQQLRRYSNIATGIHASAAYAYEGFDESIIHWFITEDGPLFFETFDKPVLEIETPKVTEEKEFEVTFTFSNQGSGKKTMTKKVTVVP
jgi:hypothetical protein